MIPNGLIVSSQALEGNPLRDSEMLATMAKAAEMGGAAGIRANGVADITAIRKRTDLPIIGIDKRKDGDGHTVITPDFEGAKAIAEAGANVIALDVSFYDSPIREDRAVLIRRIHEELGLPVLADISTFEEAVFAVEAGAEAVSTTLSGYIPGALFQEWMRYTPDFSLLQKILEAKLPTKVYGEGRFWRGEDLTRAMRMGVDGLIVGKAVTNPMAITQYFRFCTDRGCSPVPRTEARREESAHIDQLDTCNVLGLINRAEIDTADIVGAAIPQITELVDHTVAAVKKGGRIFYAGAGTSGRIATADAAECPPTYGVPDDMFQAVVAGGRAAIVNAAESCEDDEGSAKQAFDDYGVKAGDVVVGISAAGAAPFVLAFMNAAKEKGCFVAAVVNNTDTPMEEIADVTVRLCTGAEVIKGSTRMKAGSAQKMALNMFSTAVCVKLGLVYGNYMVGMKATNTKLRARAVNMFTEITGESAETARFFLEPKEWSVREALKAWEATQS